MDIKKAMLSLMGGLWVSAAICAASGGLYSLWIWGIAHYYGGEVLVWKLIWALAEIGFWTFPFLGLAMTLVIYFWEELNREPGVSS